MSAKKGHEEMLSDLETVRTLRPKLSQLESLKAKILHEVETFKAEKLQQEDVERELRVLQNERKLHVEAITAIDQDTKQLQNSYTQSNRERKAIKLRALDLIEELKPLKAEVDAIRVSIGLDVLPEMTDMDTEIFNS